MIRFAYFGVRFCQSWFDEPVTPPLPDIVILRQSRRRPASGPVSLKKSLVNDLTLPEEEIFANFSRSCRYNIRRAESKDLAECVMNSAPAPSDVDEFIAFYADFARQKGLAPLSPKRFSAIAEDGRLRISHAVLAGSVVARHAYVTAGDIVEADFSASLFRTADKETRAAIGRTNRLLNWRDMQFFKAAGFRQFDWGGLFQDENKPERKGINDFKREFGGVEVQYFEGYEAHTALGQVIMQLMPAAKAAEQFLGRLRG
jgi:hypothetical protein